MKLVATLSAATFVVVLGLSGVYAQSPGNDQGAGGPSASPPSMAPSQGGGDTPDMAPSGPSAGAMQKGQGGPALREPKKDQPPLSAETEGKPEVKPHTKAEGKGETGGKAATKAERKDDLEIGDKAATKTEGKGDRETGGQAGSKAEGDTGASGKTGSTAEGQKSDKGGKSVRLESQQVSKVKTYFDQNKPRVKAIDKDEVSISIGIALPGAIALYDLPPDVIVVGGPCPIKYFVWGDDIVLVDSCTREVVEIIVGIA
jgi:hypothetical protein